MNFTWRMPPGYAFKIIFVIATNFLSIGLGRYVEPHKSPKTEIVTLSSQLIDHRNVQGDDYTQPRHQENWESVRNCGGVFKYHQTLLTSPNYPGDYPSGVQCVYTVRSPFVCRSNFHVQFLDFDVKPSPNCEEDFLAIGEEIFCGKLSGHKIYNSSDGILRIRFNSGNSTRGKGFRLLVTRMPCDNDLSPEVGYGSKLLPKVSKNLQPQGDSSSRNTKQQLPSYEPSNSVCSGTRFNASPLNNVLPLPFNPPLHNTNEFYSFLAPQSSVLPPSLPSCCAETSRLRRFYLSSPNFPGTSTIPKDCLYFIQKSGPDVCRLRIEFKFFYLGDERQQCLDDFLEIDNQRICGCKTGIVYISQWGLGVKSIRFKTSGRRYSHSSGFILDIVQESCPYRYSQGEPLANKRVDMQQYPKLLVETNSTTRASYYFDNSGMKPTEETREGPSSQLFFFGSNLQNPCFFTWVDYARLSLESLWIQKPQCSALQ